ncbi:uncharacterized protein LOC120822437 isoform X1 [Gasterosteus aculeatus]
MFRKNEDARMKAWGVQSDGSSSRHVSASSVRAMKPGIKHLRWLHILPLVVLVAAQASCNETSAAPSPPFITTENVSTSAHYFLDVTVDADVQKDESQITAWLSQVFQNQLQNCVSPDQTTVVPTSPQNTTTSNATQQSLNTTTTAQNTTLQSNNATTAAQNTTLESSNATTAAQNTTLQSNNATTAAQNTTLQNNNTTTTPQNTTLQSNNATTDEQNTTLQNNNTTTTPQNTTLQSNNATTDAQNTTLQNNNTTTAPQNTTLQNNNTTTAVQNTTLQNNNTTTAAQNTTLQNNNTTTAAQNTTLQSNNTTTAVSTTTLQSNNTTTAVPTTTLQSNNTTAAETTKLQRNVTSTAATTTASTTTTPPATTARTTTTTPATTASTTTTTPLTTARTTTTTPATTASTTTTTPLTTASTTTTTPATTASTTTTTPATTARTTTTTPATTASTTTTTPATTASTTTTTPATTARTTTTTLATTTTSTTTTTPATTTSTTTTTLATTTTSTTTTTPAAIPFFLSTITPPPPRGLTPPNAVRVVRAIRSPERKTRAISGDNSTGLFQGIEVSCDIKTVIIRTNCSVTLRLKQKVPPCCILRTLCAASRASPDIHVVGKTAAGISPLQNGCDSEALGSCAYNGPSGAACDLSETAYVVPQRNSSHCGAENNTCNCSAYCGGTNAYYTFQISNQDLEINALTLISSVIDILNLLKQHKNCPPDVSVGCPLSILATEFKDVNVECEISATNCTVILGFHHEVPICNLSTAVLGLFSSAKNLFFNGQVTRAAICGNSIVSNSPLTSGFKWTRLNVEPASFCASIENSGFLDCQAGNVIVQLEEQCAAGLLTTQGPNVTSAQPNTTNASSNVTSSPLDTTARAPNATDTPASVTASAEGQANALLQLTGDVSRLNSSQVSQLVSQLEALLSGPNVSLALGNTSVHIVSNLLGASPEVLADSSNRIIRIVDTVGLKLVLDGKAETLLSPAVALSAKPADGRNFQETIFSISDPNNVQVRGNPRQGRSLRADSSIPQGSITLPPSLTQGLTVEEQLLANRVQFNFYQKSTVYQDSALGKRRLNSGILGASVANLSLADLRDNVTINLRNFEPVPANYVAVCVFWDFTLNNQSGGWNPRGCVLQNSTDSETVCGCNHLTSFAILLDLSRQPLLSREQATILTFITYIGCGISSIFLSITLLTYLAFGKLRKDTPSKILIQLCLALLLLNLVFLVDAWLALYPDTLGLCISTAWFLHYFLLVTFTWMGLEAVQMYLALVKVFNNHISRLMVKFSLVGWGVPMIVVIIVIAIDKDNYGLISYGRFSDGTSDGFCWLKNDIAFYVAVVAYFCVVFLFNLAMFVVVLVQLCRIKRQNPHNAHHRTTLQDVRSVVGIMMLLGLTWGFAFFAWGPVNLPFMYLFAIFNSLQGFFIFVLYCAMKENVRNQWRTYLCCGRMRLAKNSEWSRTATQKTAKKRKSPGTRMPSLRSATSSNNSSSSSSYLVSDSSELINGIGSPFEDRGITANEDPTTDVVLNEINSQYRNQQAP